MLILIPESVDFEISTTDIVVQYRERSVVSVEIDTLNKENYLGRQNYDNTIISFNLVAELRCCSLNFFEVFHKEFEIFKINQEIDDLIFWKENAYHPNSGFYEVDNSDFLKDSLIKYDPLNRLQLKHYLITGNDSYIEILASNYKISSSPHKSGK